MKMRFKIARWCLALGRDRFRNTWVHHLRLTEAMYRLVVRAIDKPELITFRGVVLRIAQRDRTITPTLLTGQYERAELDLLDSLLEPGMTIVDVGANNGVYTCIASQLVGHSGKVVSIEPISENLTALRESVALNQPATENVTIIPVAAGATSGTVRIYLDDQNSGTHSAGGVGDCWEDVTVRPVDEIVAELGLSSVDLIKIDVEGYEEQVLVGAARTIERFAPAILCEFDAEMTEACGSDAKQYAADLFAMGTVLEIDERSCSLVPIGESNCAGLRNSNLLVIPPGFGDHPIHGEDWPSHGYPRLTRDVAQFG
ncbi:MAG: FkbM family methyltransferase [Actinomycetia bacterium]|nr:FkbM family methyltransferase [Actinomycetes bacterium]